jgi:serine/threonine protein kinase
LQHPFILPFLGIEPIEDGAVHRSGMVSPWMERGTLARYVRSGEYDQRLDCYRLVSTSPRRLGPISSSGNQLSEVADGLAYLHSQLVVHGDINDVSTVSFMLDNFIRTLTLPV